MNLLQDSKKIYKIVLSSIPDIVFLTDDKGKLLYISPNVETIFRDNSQNVKDHSDISQFFRENIFHLKDLKRQGEIKDIEYEVCDKNGQKHFLLINVKHISVGEATILYVCQDITKRKKAEEEIQLSHRYARTILDSINDAISIINISDYTLASANRSFLDQIGMVESEIIGKPCFAITHHFPVSCKPPYDDCPLSETLRTGHSHSCEHVHFTSDGTKTYVEITTSPLRNKDDEIYQVVHVARDITERKLNELKRIEQLEKEIHFLEELLLTPKSIFSAQDAETINLRKYKHGFFENLVEFYGELIELALEQQVYKVEHNISQKLKMLAQKLGAMKAGPRDVIELHNEVLKVKSKDAQASKIKAYSEEGRLIVIELMGYLASYYRNILFKNFIFKN